MRHIPEQYFWERGDIVCAAAHDEVAIRVSDGSWRSSTAQRQYSDEAVTHCIQAGTWKYVGSRIGR